MRFYKRKPVYDYNNRTQSEAAMTARAKICANLVKCGITLGPVDRNKLPFEVVKYGEKKQQSQSEQE